jgi:7-cyano-7-deazaguanine synthase
MSKAVLLSGGIESIILTYDIRPSLAITVDYGQKSATSEIKASQFICKKLEIPHEIIKVDISTFINRLSNTKDEWIPFRNQFIITLSSIVCIEKEISELYIGSILEDSKFKDGSSDFIKKMSDLLSLQEGNLKLIAPYHNISIFDLVEKINIPLSLISIAHSCTSSNIPCGQCNSCFKYYEVFEILKNK